MEQSTNLGLNLITDSAEDKAMLFSTWRAKVAGNGEDSNMKIIDEAIGDLQSDVNNSSRDITDTKTLLSADKTANGNLIILEDARDVPLKSVEVTINPIRGLHGYDRPWIGGSGKNQLQVTAESSGIFTVFTDNDGNKSKIIVNGKPSDLVRFGNGFPLTAGDYILTGCPSGGGEEKYNLSIRSESVNGTVIGSLDTGSGANVTIPSDGTYYFAITIAAGRLMSNYTFRPMLRPATVSDATYEPYSNVCHIDAVSTVSINIAGKNLIDAEHPYAAGKEVKPIDGSLVDADYNTYLIPVFKGVPVTVRRKSSNTLAYALLDTSMGTITGGFRMYISPPGSTDIPTINESITPTANGYMLVSFHSSDTDILVGYGTIIGYSAYDVTSRQYSMGEIAGSPIYGGKLTINEDGSGTLVVLNESIQPVTSNIVRRSGFRYYVSSSATGHVNSTDNYQVISNLIPTITEEQISGRETLHENFCYTKASQIEFNTKKEYASVADMLADFPGLEFVYKSGRQEYQLTSETLQLFDSNQAVYSDPENELQIVYRANGIRAGSVNLTEAQLQVLLSIVQQTPVITEQPENAVAETGETVTYTVTAENVAAYQWQTKGVGEEWADAASTGNTYTYTVPTGTGWHYFRCKLTGANGLVVYSDEAYCNW